MHTDDQDVFVLQLAGSKTWRVYDAPQPLPYEDEQLGKDTPYDRARLGTPTLAATLRPRSLLYLPRGMLHEARAGDDGGSLHVASRRAVRHGAGRVCRDALRAATAATSTFGVRRHSMCPSSAGRAAAAAAAPRTRRRAARALQPRWEALPPLTAAEADRSKGVRRACAKRARHNDEQDARSARRRFGAAAARAARRTLPPRCVCASPPAAASPPRLDGDARRRPIERAAGAAIEPRGAAAARLAAAVRALCAACDGCESLGGARRRRAVARSLDGRRWSWEVEPRRRDREGSKLVASTEPKRRLVHPRRSLLSQQRPRTRQLPLERRTHRRSCLAGNRKPRC